MGHGFTWCLFRFCHGIESDVKTLRYIPYLNSTFHGFQPRYTKIEKIGFPYTLLLWSYVTALTLRSDASWKFDASSILQTYMIPATLQACLLPSVRRSSTVRVLRRCQCPIGTFSHCTCISIRTFVMSRVSASASFISR